MPGGLAADLVESLDHPMVASADRLRDLLPDPPGDQMPIGDATAASVSTRTAGPVNELEDSHHVADSDPVWAGGDILALQRTARAVTPAVVRPALEWASLVPGPVPALLRTGLDILADLTPTGRSA